MVNALNYSDPEFQRQMYLTGLVKSDLRNERRAMKGIGYDTNAKGTQIKVTDVYKTVTFRNDDRTKTVVRRNVTADSALILTFHDYTWIKNAAPRFVIQKHEELTHKDVEEIGQQVLKISAENEDTIVGRYSQELAQKYQAERLEKFPELRIKRAPWHLFDFTL